MCEFCVKHGEGRKWYLNMQNYSRELWAEPGRADFTDEFIARFEEAGKAVATMERVRNVPLLNRLVRSMVSRVEKAYHWGQVLPIEDVDLVLDFQDSIVRLACPCRRLTTGRDERFCFGLGVDIAGICGGYPDYSASMEVLGKEEAKDTLHTLDRQGLVHSVWTFKTPYIGAVCNCDRDCMAYRLQVRTGLMQMMFRSEYVGRIDWEACTGCKRCVATCQFGALRYSHSQKKALIDAAECYGCGVCRTVCEHEAITMLDRRDYAWLQW